MTKLLGGICAALAVAGCSNPQPATSVVATAATSQTCVRELPVGSSIPVTRCRTAEEIARDAQVKQAVEDAISRNRSAPSGSVPRN